MHLPLRNAGPLHCPRRYVRISYICEPSFAQNGRQSERALPVHLHHTDTHTLVLNRHVQAIHALLVLIPPCACSGQPGSTYTQNKCKAARWVWPGLPRTSAANLPGVDAPSQTTARAQIDIPVLPSLVRGCSRCRMRRGAPAGAGAP